MNDDERGFVMGNIMLFLLGTIIILACYGRIHLCMVVGFVFGVVLVVNRKLSGKKKEG